MLNRLLAALAAIALAAFLLFWFTGKKAEMKFAKPVASIGTSTTISVQTDDPVGVKGFSASLEQNGQSQTVYEDKIPNAQKKMIYVFNAGKKHGPFLERRSGQTDSQGEIQRLSRRHDYLDAGCPSGAAAADHRSRWQTALHQSGRNGTGRLGCRRKLDRSRASMWPTIRLAASPCPANRTTVRTAFRCFRFPWNVAADTIPLAFASNGAGTEVTTTFWTKVFPKSFRSSDINVTDRDLTKVVGELDPDGTGQLSRALRQAEQGNARRPTRSRFTNCVRRPKTKFCGRAHSSQ